MKIYIAAPLHSSGEVYQNIQRVVSVANELLDLGYYPYVPHFNQYLEEKKSRPAEFWINYDFQFLKDCDCLLRLGGYSKGADLEIEFAKKNNIPIFYSIKEIENLRSNYGKQKRHCVANYN